MAKTYVAEAGTKPAAPALTGRADSATSKNNAEEVIRLGNRLYSQKGNLDILWQALAEMFHPARATFTIDELPGTEFADHLYESMPVQNRRDFALAMGALLRPKAQKWFSGVAKERSRMTDAASMWLDDATDATRTMLYSAASQFRTSIAESDDDFSTFGNAVLSMTENSRRNGFIFDCHHLKLCAWAQNTDGVVDQVHRNMPKFTLREFCSYFGHDKLSDSHRSMYDTNPFHEIVMRHVVLPAAEYDQSAIPRGERKKFVSVYLIPGENRIVRQGTYYVNPYHVRRWSRSRNSAYAHSPAAMIGLCDARTLQAMSQTILEAGEMVVNPPMLATEEAVLGQPNLYAGGVTWASAEYDERKGEALRPLLTGGRIDQGLELKADIRQVLAAAWNLNKLTLPSDKDMTAREVDERISEYIRSIGPLIEPFEADNAEMLDKVFTTLNMAGWFGPRDWVPAELREAEIEFEFETPVHAAYKRQRTLRGSESVQYVSGIVEKTGRTDLFDELDLVSIVRQGVAGIGGPVNFLTPSEVVAAKREADAKAKAAAEAEAKAQQMIANVKNGADAAGAAANAVPAVRGAMEQMRGAKAGPFGDPSELPFPQGNLPQAGPVTGIDPSIMGLMEGLGA